MDSVGVGFVNLLPSDVLRTRQRSHVEGRRLRSERRPYSARRRVVRAEVDVTSFPPEPSKDAIPVDREPEEYTQLRQMLRGTSVFLVGMMGCGKTTVGTELAKRLRYSYVDTDEVIQTAMKMSIPDIFENHGEEGFRQVEAAVVQQVAAYVRAVISTGGGAVTQQSNWGHLQSGVVVWLDAPPQVLFERVKGDKSRPLLKVDDPLARLESLLSERRQLYQQADVTVGIEEDQGVEEIAFNVTRALIRFIEMK